MKKLFFLLSLLLITLLSFSQSRYISATTKKIVFNRDGGVCKCCGSSLNLEFDHIIPYSCGGSSKPSNIQLLCQKCNRSKSNSCYCKIHNNKVGYNCCDDGLTNSVNRLSSVAPTQCLGTTKKGLRCRNRTTNSSGRCHLH
jgi:hypothetical protein